MENLNIDVINRKKESHEEIIDIIDKNYLISNFNSNLSQYFKNYKNKFEKKNIYFYFVFKYINSKSTKQLIKYHSASEQILQNKLEFAYIYSLFYIYLKFELFFKLNNDNKEKKENQANIDKIISIKDFIDLIEYFYKSKIITWREVINILKYLIYQLKEHDNELLTSIKVSILSIILKFFGKIIKLISKLENEKEKEEINKEIKNNFFEDLFEILSDGKNTGNYLYLMRNMIKEESIFVLVKLISKKNFISDENKKYIEDNIIKIFKNNFRKEHINYFYKKFRKILLKFNKFNPHLTKEKDSEENFETNFNMINKDFSFLKKMNEILIKIINEEREQISNNNCYYCDKGFAFNNKELDKIGFQVKDITYTKKNNNIFSILFSFQLKQSNNDKENKIIFSIVDANNNEKLTLYENGENICLRYFTQKLREINLQKVEYNKIFNFLFYYDKNDINISINNIDMSNILKKETDLKPANFKFPEKFKIFGGCPEKIKNQKNEQYSFYGILYPILLFELNKLKKNDTYKLIKTTLSNVKNKYYLIAEEYFNEHYNKKNKKEKEIFDAEKIMHNYEIYYGLNDDLIKQKKLDKILKLINNMILYINPYIIVSSFNKKEKIYKDYNIYENETNKNISYFYEFNTVPSLDQGKIYSFRDFSVVSFFKINNGLNFVILQIEILYNFILVLNSKEEFINSSNINNKEFFEQM